MHEGVSTGRWGHRALVVGAYALFVAMGLSSWLPVNSIYLQMPFYYQHLYSYAANINSGIAFSIVAANILPSVFMILSRHYHVSSTPLLLLVLIGAILVCLLFALYCACLGASTLVNFALLLAFSFAAGAVGGMTSVLFWPFGAKYSPTMLNGLTVGTSLSAIFPVVVDLLQDTTSHYGNSRVSVFFAVMSGLSVISLVAYLLILRLPFVMRVSHKTSPEEPLPTTAVSSHAEPSSPVLLQPSAGDQPKVTVSTGPPSSLAPDQPLLSPYGGLKWWQLRHSFPIMVMAVHFVSCAFHFFLMGIPSYLVPCTTNFSDCFTILLRVGMVGNFVGRVIPLFLKRGPLPLVLSVQLLMTSLMFVCGRPGGYSPYGLYTLNALENIVFGITNTLIYQGAASGVHLQNDPKMFGGPVRADNFQLSKALGFVQQMGSAAGITISLILTLTKVLFNKSVS